MRRLWFIIPILFCCVAASFYLPHRRLAFRTTPSAAFTYYSAVFDGTNDYCSRGADLTGIADGKTGLISLWLKMGSGSSDTADYYIMRSGARLYVMRNSGGRFYISAKNAAGATVVAFYSGSASVVKAGGWYHLLASWDLGTAGRRHIYINGADNTTQQVFSDDDIDYTTGNFFVGSDTAGSTLMNGSMCEVYFTTEWLDITDAANRLKFRTAGGCPANLGADGSTPTGTQPLLYLHNEVPNWESNLGSGGGMTEVGTIVDGATDKPCTTISPADVPYLVAWYKADAMVGMTNGEAVTGWEDSGPNGYDLVSNVDPYYTNNAALINNQPFIYFANSPYMKHGASTVYDQPNTFFIVGFNDVLSSVDTFLSGTNAATYEAIYGASTAKLIATAGTAVGGANSSLISRFYLHEVTLNDPTSYSMHTNGVDYASAASSPGTNSLSGLVVGAIYNTGNRLVGGIAEIIIYNSNVSAGDRTSIRTYFTDKYGAYADW